MDQERAREPGKIGEILLSAGIISEGHLKQALQLQVRDGGKLGSALVKIGAIDEDVLATFLGMQRGTETIKLSERQIAGDVLSLVSTATAYRYGAIPVARSDDLLTVVLVDPEDREALTTLQKETGLEIRPQIAPQTSIYTALKRLYPTGGSAHNGYLGDPAARERLRYKLQQARLLIDEIERALTGE